MKVFVARFSSLFLDAYDLSGKNVMLFTTHEGSGLADAVSVVQREEPGASVSTIISLAQYSINNSNQLKEKCD